MYSSLTTTTKRPGFCVSSEEQETLSPQPMIGTVVEVSLYVHRNRSFISDGSPGHPTRLSHSFPEL